MDQGRRGRSTNQSNRGGRGRGAMTPKHEAGQSRHTNFKISDKLAEIDRESGSGPDVDSHVGAE